MQCAMLLVILGVTILAVGVYSETAVPQLVGSPWQAGAGRDFKMNFQVTMLKAVKGGWNMKILFSGPVTSMQIWVGKQINVSADKKVYTIKNMRWNRNFKKCGTLDVEFIGRVARGVAIPSATVEFARKNGGNDNLDNGACSTTAIPTTRLPTTTGSPQPTTTRLPTTTTEAPNTTPAPPPITYPTGIPTSDLTAGEAVAVQRGDWPTGFEMSMRIRLLATVSGGWKIKLEFSEPASDLQIWRASVEAVSSDYKVYWVGNMSWNANLPKCSELQMTFSAKKVSGTPSPSLKATFYRVGQSGVILDPEACSPNPTTTVAPKPTTSKPVPTTSKPAPTTSKPAPTTSKPVPTTSAPAPTTARPSTNTAGPVTTTAEEKSTASPKPTTANPVTTAGSTAGPTTERPTATTPTGTSKPEKYDYGLALHDSILFYNAQRSGKLPSNNRVPWRKDSALNDRGENGQDLTGGWYDAGDFVKFGFPMASSATVLAWGLVEYSAAYQAAGELNNALDSIKWATDYFIKAHTNKFEFYGQVGDGYADHAFWGRPEDMTMKRPAFKITTDKPGSELAAETAAALAAASIAFNPTDSDYAATLRQHAEELYEFADTYRGKYTDAIPNAASFYGSHSGYNDELVWGAAWLYRATNNAAYLTKAEKYYNDFNLGGKAWGFSWDDKTAGAQLLLAQITGKDMYKNAVRSFLDDWLQGGSVTKTPKGLAWRDKWGANRYAANAAFLALVAADTEINPAANREFATKQIHYMLGDAGRSFVVGFGTNPPKRPHHRSSSCPLAPNACGWNEYNANTDNPHVLVGALVGGPDQNDNYKDDRNDYIMNEVTTDYNAGFQSAVAGIKQLHL